MITSRLDVLGVARGGRPGVAKYTQVCVCVRVRVCLRMDGVSVCVCVSLSHQISPVPIEFI